MNKVLFLCVLFFYSISANCQEEFVYDLGFFNPFKGKVKSFETITYNVDSLTQEKKSFAFWGNNYKVCYDKKGKISSLGYFDVAKEKVNKPSILFPAEVSHSRKKSSFIINPRNRFEIKYDKSSKSYCRSYYNRSLYASDSISTVRNYYYSKPSSFNKLLYSFGFDSTSYFRGKEFDDLSLSSKQFFSYDSFGFLSEYDFCFFRNGQTKYTKSCKVETKFDDKNQLIEVIMNYNKNDIKKYNFFYSEDGQLIKMVSVFSRQDGEIWHQSISSLVYDSHGNWIKKEGYVKSSFGIEHTLTERKFEYYK